MKKKNNLKIVLIFIIVFIITSFGIYFFLEYKKYNILPSVKELINEKKKQNYSDKDNNKKDTKQYVNELPNYRTQYNNQDIMGRLEIPNLNVNTLVTRSVNNVYYLNYNLYKQYDEIGIPFFDYRNTNLSTDRQINIYGHNTENRNIMDKLPFINLEAYSDENIFKNYKDVYLSIDEKQVNYEVIAIKIITEYDNEHMKVIFYNDNDYINHVNKLLENTLYKEDDVKIDTNDRLLVLQVCHYNPANTYLLVICKEKK